MALGWKRVAVTTMAFCAAAVAGAGIYSVTQASGQHATLRTATNEHALD